MGVVGDLLQWLFDFATATMDQLGLPGLFLLMVAESMFLPVPSEAVMPFAGVLAARGHASMTWWTVLLASSAGSMVGSYTGYYMGRFGLLPLVERYGKYVLIQRHHITAAHDYFARRGAWAVFLCRFIPGVRHISSIPAGAARMDHLPFALATLAGATLWNMFLFFLGYRYGDDFVHGMKPYMDVVGIALFVLLAGYIAYEWRKGRRARLIEAAAGATPLQDEKGP